MITATQMLESMVRNPPNQGGGDGRVPGHFDGTMR